MNNKIYIIFNYYYFLTKKGRTYHPEPPPLVGKQSIYTLRPGLRGKHGHEAVLPWTTEHSVYHEEKEASQYTDSVGRNLQGRHITYFDRDQGYHLREALCRAIRFGVQAISQAQSNHTRTEFNSSNPTRS